MLGGTSLGSTRYAEPPIGVGLLAARALSSQHFLSGFFEWNTSGQRLFLTTCEIKSAAATFATL